MELAGWNNARQRFSYGFIRIFTPISMGDLPCKRAGFLFICIDQSGAIESNPSEDRTSNYNGFSFCRKFSRNGLYGEQARKRHDSNSGGDEYLGKVG